MLIEKGTTTRIPVFLKDINEAGAVTCIITYPDENIEIQSIDCDVEGYLFNVQNGEIKIAFENIEGVEIDNDQALFEIVATIKNSDIDNSKFRISSLSEVANKYGDIDYNARFNIPKLTSDKEEAGFYLEENYPNPFKITTTIAYSIPENGSVRLSVVNLLGEELELIVDEFKEAGKYSVEYDARGLSAGMYLYRLEVDGETRNFNASGTMQIIK